MTTATEPREQSTLAGTIGNTSGNIYHGGLVLQTLGAAIVAVLYPVDSPFYTVGIMLFDVGALLSAVSVRINSRIAKIFVLGSVLTGLAVQIGGSVAAPEEYAARVILGGIGLVCAGAAGMAGKEAYCFAYREGWILMLIGFPGVVLANLVGKENRIFNSLAFSAIFLLLLSLTGRKLRQGRQAVCSGKTN